MISRMREIRDRHRRIRLTLSTSTTRTWATPTIPPSCSSWASARNCCCGARGSAKSSSTRACGSSASTTATSGCPPSCPAVIPARALLPRMARSYVGLPSPAVYTLEDMADDAAALLDHLGVDRAHVVGASMGGMIAQVFAARHAARTRTLAVIFSSNNQPVLPPPGPRQLAAILQRPKDTTREVIIDNAVRVNKIIGSPGYPTPQDRVRADAIEGYDRSYYPAGRRPAVRRDPRQRQPVALRPADHGADGGHPRQGGQADAPVRRTGDRPRDHGLAAGALRRHGPRTSRTAVGRHRRRAEDHVRRGSPDSSVEFGRPRKAR